MLVLSRKLGEKIMLGEDIEITVCLIAGNRIRLGIEAPNNTKILRGELKSRTEPSDASSESAA